jgi:aminoglycoside 6-adenylyltransferase
MLLMPIVRQLINWAEQQDAVRAMLLTSTRAIPNAHIDIFSDYDVVLIVQDIHPFIEDKTWLQVFGKVLVTYWDPIHPKPSFGIEQSGNIIQYADGLKIDFTLWPVDLLRRIATAPTPLAELDMGYAVLMDKDHLTDDLRAPTYKAYIPAKPSNEAFQQVINNFFSSVPYVAKCLWRDEVMPAKWCLDFDMKHPFLRQMLEWRVELDHDWSVAPGVLGKGLKKRLPPDIWTHLESTYAGAAVEANWEALYQTIALFRRVANEVAAHLGYAYPHDLDQRVTALAQKMQSTPTTPAAPQIL